MEDELWQLVLVDTVYWPEETVLLFTKFSQEFVSVIFIFLGESGYFSALGSAAL